MRGSKDLLDSLEHTAGLLKKRIGEVARATLKDKYAREDSDNIRLWDHLQAGEKVEIGAILAVHLFEAVRMLQGFIIMEDRR